MFETLCDDRDGILPVVGGSVDEQRVDGVAGAEFSQAQPAILAALCLGEVVVVVVVVGESGEHQLVFFRGVGAGEIKEF